MHPTYKTSFTIVNISDEPGNLLSFILVIDQEDLKNRVQEEIDSRVNSSDSGVNLSDSGTNNSDAGDNGASDNENDIGREYRSDTV